MIVHPVIGALRGDDSPQRAAQSAAHGALTAWHALPQVANLRSEIQAFATCRPMADCPQLSRLFDDGDAAALDLSSSFVANGVDLLKGAPLAHLAQRHSTDGTLSMLLLARTGNVTLTLVAIDGEALAAGPQPRNVSLWPGEAWEHILTGHGEAELVDCRDPGSDMATLRRRTVSLHPGKVICRDAERQGSIIRSVQGSLVLLRLQRRRPLAGTACEYALDTGKLVHRAAGNPRDSRIELMMALLGRMKRRDAAPIMAEIARDEGSDSLRWQALRECLALDTLTGFMTLSAVAQAEDDPLFVPAASLRSQLIENHPQLASLQPCQG